jgi:alpha-amylase
MRVLLDVVYNHPGYDSRYLTDPRTAHWLRSEHKGTCGQDDLTSCLSGLPDFRTELPAVAGYLMDAHLGLARRVGLDGFRLDTVKHVDHPFWQEHRRRVREELFPGFFLVGEVWGGDPDVLEPWFAGDEMDAGFDFSFAGSTLGWVMGRGRTVAFDRYLKSRDRVREGYLLAHFLSSHDVPGALFQLGGDLARFQLAAALQMTTRGLPVVYYGEEVGRRGGDWPENRSDMPWGDRGVAPGAGLPRDEVLREGYRRLIGIRRAHPALAGGLHESVSSDGDLLVFARRHPASGEVVLVAVNRGEQPAPPRAVPVPPEWRGRPAAVDAWSGETVPIVAAGGADSAEADAPFLLLEVPALSFRILALPSGAAPSGTSAGTTAP